MTRRCPPPLRSVRRILVGCRLTCLPPSALGRCRCGLPVPLVSPNFVAGLAVVVLNLSVVPPVASSSILDGISRSSFS